MGWRSLWGRTISLCPIPQPVMADDPNPAGRDEAVSRFHYVFFRRHLDLDQPTSPGLDAEPRLLGQQLRLLALVMHPVRQQPQQQLQQQQSRYSNSSGKDGVDNIATTVLFVASPALLLVKSPCAKFFVFLFSVTR